MMISRSISEKEVAKEPFLVVNKTGLPVTLCLGEHQHYSFSVSDHAHSDYAHQVSHTINTYKTILATHWAIES